MAWKKPGSNGDGPDGGRNPWKSRGNGIGDTARQWLGRLGDGSGIGRWISGANRGSRIWRPCNSNIGRSNSVVTSGLITKGPSLGLPTCRTAPGWHSLSSHWNNWPSAC